MQRMNLYISIETTGLSPLRDDLVEIAVLDDAKNVVFHSIVNPIRDSGTYPESEITAELRTSAPRWAEIESDVAKILQGNRIFAWDLLFTTSFLASVIPKGAKTVDVQSWFTRRDAKYPASLRGTWDDFNPFVWRTWHQRCVHKCETMIECIEHLVFEYWAKKASESRPKDAFFAQWQRWNRIAPKYMTDADKRRFAQWILGYKPITKTFFGMLFSRYHTTKHGWVCARVGVVDGAVVVDTVGWLKNAEKMRKIRDWLILNHWIQTGYHFETPLTDGWKAVMKALKNSSNDERCYAIFLQNITCKAL